jgi:hypothetical protein
VPSLGDKEDRRALVSNIENFSFPNSCVCCMSPVVQRRDLTFGYEINKFLREEQPERLGPRYTVHEIGHGVLTIPRVPYCDEHAHEFDQRLSQARARKDQSTFSLHRGYENRGATFGFLIEPRGFTDYNFKDMLTPRSFKDFVFEFDNPDYAEAFRKNNLIISDPTTAGGWAREVKETFSLKTLLEAKKVRRINKFRKKANVDALLSMIDDPDADVRFHTILALGLMEDARVAGAFERFVDKTRNDPDERVRRVALSCVGRSKDLRALDVVIEAAADPSAQHRMEVAGLLGSFHEPRAVETLGGFLSDPEVAVRVRAVLSLGLQGEAGKQLLRRALDDENPVVRSTAEPWVRQQG